MPTNDQRTRVDRPHLQSGEEYYLYHESAYDQAERCKRIRTFQTGEYAKAEHGRLEQIGEEIKSRVRITKYEIYTIDELLYEAK